MKNIKDYYLLIEKVIDLPSPKRNFIMDMYRDMLHRYGEPNSKDLVSCLFNTLEMGGFIANRQEAERSKKLDDLVDG
jgi:hypothetical protein